MKISKLELARYIEAYQAYLKDRENKEQYYKVQDYLEEFGLHDIFDLIDLLVLLNIEFDKIVKVLELVGVGVV